MTQSNSVTAAALDTAAAGKPKKARTFATQLRSIQDMVFGLTVRADVLKDKGLSPEFITAMQQLWQDIQDVDNRRNAIRLQHMSVTQELTAQMSDIQKRYRLAKMRIKLELPREEWSQYGFEDVR